jgi:hypothetical protein
MHTDSPQATQFRQRTWIRYRQHSFRNEHGFAVGNTVSTANTDLLWTTQFQQQTLIRCRQDNFGSKRWFIADNSVSATNTDFRQRTLIPCGPHDFGNKKWFIVDNTIWQRKVIWFFLLFHLYYIAGLSHFLSSHGFSHQRNSLAFFFFKHSR